MKKNTTPKVKAPTIAEERESIEKTGLIRLSCIKQSNTLMQVLPEALKKALRPLNKAGDTITIMGCAVPAKILHEAAGLMGEYAVTIETNGRMIEIKYKSSPDSRSKMTIYAVKEQDARYLHPAFTDESIPEPAKVDAWIQKACSKDDARPYQMKTYGQFATDGWRIHYDRKIPVTMPEPDFSSPQMAEQVPNILSEASHVDNAALAPVDALIAAMKQMKKANKETACLYVNGRMDISALAGDAMSVIRNVITDGYQHSGDNVTLKINPQFVIDALSGMSGDVVIGIGEPRESGGRTLYISDGKREAVIMSKLD